jgi:proteic killer suppression protein
MISSIRHKGLRLLWETGDGSKLPPSQVRRIERMLGMINRARQVPQDFEPFKNWNIHKLSGELKHHWSIKVDKNFLIIFCFDGQNAYDIDYIDYH